MKLTFLATLVALLIPNLSTAQQGPPPVTTALPVMKQVVEKDLFTGRFEPKDEVVVRSRVSGYLQSVHFTDGSVVEKDQLLFTIDPAQFETALRQAKAAISVAQATFDFANEQLERAQSLIRNGTVPQSTVDERREAFLSAQGNLEEARADMELAQLNLDYTQIRAPMAGRIDNNFISVGNLITENTSELTSIVSLSPIHFLFDIDEQFFLTYSRNALQRGEPLSEGGGHQEVSISLSDATIPPVNGVLDFAENRIDDETGTIRLRAEVPNPDDILTPGLFGTITVPGSLPYEATLIPDRAIAADQNRRLVMVVDAEGKVAPRPVVLGPIIDGYRVVRSGLGPDDAVVIDGLARARPGATVDPQRVELPAVAEK
ncbi:MAG: efflux RND transporter periplasmic adaptor subunit [Sulfitobacter sp.]